MLKKLMAPMLMPWTTDSVTVFVNAIMYYKVTRVTMIITKTLVQVTQESTW